MATNSHGTESEGDHTPEVEVPDKRPETLGYEARGGWFVIQEETNPVGWIASKPNEVYR